MVVLCFPSFFLFSVFIYLTEKWIPSDITEMYHRGWTQQTLNLNFLCSESDTVLFPKINFKPTNNTLACWSRSRAWCCESSVKHGWNVGNFKSSSKFMVFRFLPPSKHSLFHTYPIKSVQSAGENGTVPHPQSLCSNFYFRKNNCSWLQVIWSFKFSAFY